MSGGTVRRIFGRVLAAWPCRSCVLAALAFCAVALGPERSEGRVAPPTVGVSRVDVLGDPLPPGALARFGSANRFQDAESMRWVGFAPDGKTILSDGSMPGKRFGRAVRVWDAASGRLLRALPVFVGSGTRLALSRDGRVVAGFSQNERQVVTLDTATGRVMRIFTPDDPDLLNGPGITVALSPDGGTVAAAYWRD
jgi:hypothetical protein